MRRRTNEPGPRVLRAAGCLALPEHRGPWGEPSEWRRGDGAPGGSVPWPMEGSLTFVGAPRSQWIRHPQYSILSQNGYGL